MENPVDDDRRTDPAAGSNFDRKTLLQAYQWGYTT